MGKKTFIGNIINEVFSLFGVGGHYETYSDISIQPLLTKGAAYDRQRRASIIVSDGDTWTYARAMQQSQRQYRRKYSAATIAGYGYAPVTNATISVLDSPLALSYIQNNVDAQATEITFLEEGTSTIDRVAFFGLQNEPDWSNFNSTLVQGGNNYRYTTANKTSATDITIDLRRYHQESITGNLLMNYGYIELNGTVEIDADTTDLTGTSGVDATQIRIEVGTAQTITFGTTPSTSWNVTTNSLPNGSYVVEVYETDSLLVETLVSSSTVVVSGVELYTVGSINGNLFGDPLQYKTTVTSTSDGVTTVDIFTDTEDIVKVVPSATYDTETMQVEYVTSVVDEYYIYIEDLDTLPANIRTTTPLELTPIITVKQENEILDQEDRNLQLMMRNVGVDPESIFPSLGNEKLNSAYLIYGVPFDTTNTACIGLLFDMFNTSFVVQGNIQVNISNLDMSYKYGITKTEVVGSIGVKGTSTKVIFDEPSTDDNSETTHHYQMVLKKQVTEEEYIELRITDLELTYRISGELNVANMNAGGDEARFLIPIDLLHGLGIRDYYDVYEESLALMSYAEETVYLEWYETMFFQFVMTVVATYFLGPWGMILMQVIFAVIDYLLDALGIDGDWATAIRMVVAIVMAMSGDTSQLMYQLAGAAMSVMQIYFKDHGQRNLERYQNDMENIDDAEEDLKEVREEAQEVKDMEYLSVVAQHGRALKSSRMPFGYSDSPESFYNRMSPEFMYDENSRVFDLNWDSQNQMMTG